MLSKGAFEMTAKQSLALRIGLDCALITICATLFSKNHLVDGFLRPLNLHDHRAVPFVPHPAGTAVHLCGMAGTIAEADALDPAIEGDVLAKHIHHLPNLVSLCPR